MPYVHDRSGARNVRLHLLCASLALAIAGCANTPTNRMGIPWWPQGPGNAPTEGGNDGATGQSQAVPGEQTSQPPRVPETTSTPPTASVPSNAVNSQPPPPESPVAVTQASPSVPDTTRAPDATRATVTDRYTQAVHYGDLIFVSGQIANDPATGQIISGDINSQMRTTMDNVQRVLESQGMTMSNVVSVTMYLKHINDLQEADQVYESYFRRSLPARTVIQAAELPRGSLVQVSVIAGK